MRIEIHQGPGYDEWFIQRLSAQKIANFTTIQQLAVKEGVCNLTSMVVCAPTSSGKTLVGELALLASLKNGGKTLYLVSHKALAEQKFDDFQKAYGADGREPLAKVGIATGDREEGDPNADILVTTYEKAMSLVMSGRLQMSDTTIVADELQILGEEGRGAEIEVLCAALRQRGPRQIIALTATVSNGEDLAGWLNCALVRSVHRDVELFQEIWFGNQVYTVKFGQDVGSILSKPGLPTTTLDAVEMLQEEGRGPVLVFTETRGDALKLAADYSARRAKTPEGFKFAEQLELFSEATEFSVKLKTSSETSVAFHTADLTPSERSVVEQGLMDGHFDVCFATPTLAAGVNFPFRTVLFDRVRRRYISPANMPLGTYRNMSGRAGRLGMHENGFSIIIPKDNIELQHAKNLVGPDNEPLYSKLSSLSVRKIILQLISCECASDAASSRKFLENTLFWYQVQDKNPRKLDEIVQKIEDAIKWLVDAEMLVGVGEKYAATKLGQAVSRTGLLPSTALSFISLLRGYSDNLEKNFEDFEVALLLAACSSDEFDKDIGQRFLPYIGNDVSSEASRNLVYPSKKFSNLAKVNDKNVIHCVYALYLFISGEIERKIGAASGLPSGQLHRFSTEIEWIFNGLRHIAAVPNVGVSQKVMNQIGIFAKRVAYGVPMELIDLVRIARKYSVPGFGRQRALALKRAGLWELEKIAVTSVEELTKIVTNSERAKLLIQAINKAEDDPFKRAERIHKEFAKQYGLYDLVSDLYEKIGNDYEIPVEKILRLEQAWSVIKVDDGIRQGVPDLMVTLGNKSIVLECKTTTKRPPQINKEEAFAVLHKAADIKGAHCVTLGKPGFETFAEAKACASSDITLLRNSFFVEAMLLLRSGRVTPEQAFEWLSTPGVSEIERLGEISLV